MTKQAKESVLERDQRDNVEIFIAEMLEMVGRRRLESGRTGTGTELQKSFKFIVWMAGK